MRKPPWPQRCLCPHKRIHHAGPAGDSYCRECHCLKFVRRFGITALAVRWYARSDKSTARYLTRTRDEIPRTPAARDAYTRAIIELRDRAA